MNVGKHFEQMFRKSIPEYCYVYRLKDSAQSYSNSGNTKFSWDNPCDFFVFDTNRRILFALELKSTKSKSMTYEFGDIDSSGKMIKKHQIKSLADMSKYPGIASGFIFNFRDEKNNTERTYFQSIRDFAKMCISIDKKSFNESDLLTNHSVEIQGTKKRVNYSWNIDKFITEYTEV